MNVETVPSRGGGLPEAPAPPPRQERVAQDMSAIFGEQRLTPLPRQRSLTVIRPAGRRRLRPLAVAAAALCLIGTGAVTLFDWNRTPEAAPRPVASAAQPDRIAAAAPIAPPVSEPELRTSPPADEQDAEAAPSRTEPSARTKPRPAASGGRSDSGKPQPIASARAEKVKTAGRAKPGTRESGAGSSVPLVEPCSPTEPGCRLHGVVLAEDARLRDAYSQAQSAGVKTATLTRYQRRWERLLKRAAEEPDDTLKGLRVMTQELIEESRDAVRRGEAR